MTEQQKNTALEVLTAEAERLFDKAEDLYRELNSAKSEREAILLARNALAKVDVE